MHFKHSLLAAATLALAAIAPHASAKPFKWAGSTDIQTMDIHSQNSALGNGIHAAVYESLVMFNSRTLKVEPLLATSWQQVSPTQLRVKLRQGVKFSDGSTMTADDVVFSLQRAMGKSSTYAIYTQSMDRIAKVDGESIDIFLKNPNPVLLNQLTELRVMSKAWSEKNNAVEPKDIKSKDETFSHRNAMGTGPFVLKEWVPDQKLVFAANPQWWNAGKSEGNVTEIVYTPIKSEATRIAALLSGEVDMVRDTSLQDLERLRANPSIKVMEMVENRTVYLALDQFRDELPGSSVKGKNPLKDLRVRKALYQAIDVATLQRVTMRGMSKPTGAMVSPLVNGWTEAVDKRLPYDPNAAKALLADAGYKDGFEVDFACSNNSIIQDENLCQAITSMWARVGVKAKLRTMPSITYYPMAQRHEASITLLSWGVPTFDALYTLQSLTRTKTTGGDGNYNLGRYSNERMDYVVDRVKTEIDQPVRNRLLTEGLQLQNDTVANIPLHNQMLAWAMKKNVELVQRPDNRIDWRLIKVN
ncbi:ABC transporter substrate-binding protein [Acidovorax sp. Root217]|uniref:ABC transporter substrate-binding protein n=1 Tax=Acidovorax sp. Root217 TaxID=1736492 RepID=UPI00070D38D1|nr:ABC transporter substrate-binding protein [Acidovorax sp. Root217]KRC26947.1 ABC transporter substrate-binding protein [Acidovorax sp. Root217]